MCELPFLLELLLTNKLTARSSSAFSFYYDSACCTNVELAYNLIMPSVRVRSERCMWKRGAPGQVEQICTIMGAS